VHLSVRLLQKVDRFYLIEEVGEEIKYGGNENMWKYLAALLVVLLSLGGLVAAQAPATAAKDCADCYANIITQKDTQTIQDIKLGTSGDIDNVAIGNEGLSAAIIVTQAPEQPAADAMFVPAPFARIDQVMDQSISKIGPDDPTIGEGAKGITWNKAIQAAWVLNQGNKELETVNGVPTYVKEGSYISQSTTQLTNNVFDYASREGAKVLNVDNKLAMIVDDMNAIINLQAAANSEAADSQSSAGTITNSVDVTVSGTDP
jgi:hypothetical protein